MKRHIYSLLISKFLIILCLIFSGCGPDSASSSESEKQHQSNPKVERSTKLADAPKIPIESKQSDKEFNTTSPSKEVDVIPFSAHDYWQQVYPVMRQFESDLERQIYVSGLMGFGLRDLEASVHVLEGINQAFSENQSLVAAVNDYIEIAKNCLRSRPKTERVQYFNKVTEQKIIILTELSKTDAAYLVQAPPPFELRKPTVTLELKNIDESLNQPLVFSFTGKIKGSHRNNESFKTGIKIPTEQFASKNTVTYSIWPGEYQAKLSIEHSDRSFAMGNYKMETGVTFNETENPLKRITGATTFEVDTQSEIKIEYALGKLVINLNYFDASESAAKNFEKTSLNESDIPQGYFELWRQSSEKGGYDFKYAPKKIEATSCTFHLFPGKYLLLYNNKDYRETPSYENQHVVVGEIQVEEGQIKTLNVSFGTLEILPPDASAEHDYILRIQQVLPEGLSDAIDKTIIREDSNVESTKVVSRLIIPEGEYNLDVLAVRDQKVANNVKNRHLAYSKRVNIENGKPKQVKIKSGFAFWTPENDARINVDRTVDIFKHPLEQIVEFKVVGKKTNSNKEIKLADFEIGSKYTRSLFWVLDPGEYSIDIRDASNNELLLHRDFEIKANESVNLNKLFSIQDVAKKTGQLKIDTSNNLGFYSENGIGEIYVLNNESNSELLHKVSTYDMIKTRYKEDGNATLDLLAGAHSIIWNLGSCKNVFIDRINIEDSKTTQYNLHFGQINYNISNLPSVNYNGGGKLKIMLKLLRPKSGNATTDNSLVIEERVSKKTPINRKIFLPIGEYSIWLDWYGYQVSQDNVINVTQNGIETIKINPSFITLQMPESIQGGMNASENGFFYFTFVSPKTGKSYIFNVSLEYKKPGFDSTIRYPRRFYNEPSIKRLTIAVEPGQYQLRSSEGKIFPIAVEPGQTIELDEYKAFIEHIHNIVSKVRNEK